MKCALCDDKTCLRSSTCNTIYPARSSDNTSEYLIDENTRSIYEVTCSMPKDIPRIGEVKMFIEKSGIKRVGVAFCKGLQEEAREIVGFLSSQNDVRFFSVICAYEDHNKRKANYRASSLPFEVSCNPVGQGEILNDLGTELNITIGLCVGHDILFSKYSAAPVTNLVVKDRIYRHKPLNFFSD